MGQPAVSYRSVQPAPAREPFSAAAPVLERREAFECRARPMMALDCRFEAGQRKAFKYPDLLSCEFDGASRITLYFEAATVTVEGRNLTAGYDHLVECKVASIQERHCSEFELGDHASYVDRIRISEPQPRGPAAHPAIRPNF